MTVTRIDVFGGLRVIGRGDVFSPFSVRSGGFLALLVLARGQPVGASQIVDWLWGADAAPSAGNQLQRLVGQLRRQFEPGLEARSAGSVILGAPDGYRLAPAVESDLFDVDRQVAEPRWTTAERARVLRVVRKPPFAGLRTPDIQLAVFVNSLCW